MDRGAWAQKGSDTTEATWHVCRRHRLLLSATPRADSQEEEVLLAWLTASLQNICLLQYRVPLEVLTAHTYVLGAFTSWVLSVLAR